MDLKDLLELGQWSGDIVLKSIRWNGHDIDVRIKKDLSPADFEFIYTDKKSSDDSYMARRVSRSVLIGDDLISYDDASKIKPSLLAVMCAAINEVQKEITPAKKS